MEFKDNRMEIERVNNKKLLEEIKYIVVSSSSGSYQYQIYFQQGYIQKEV